MKSFKKFLTEYNHIKKSFEEYRTEFENLSDHKHKVEMYKSLLNDQELNQIENSTMTLEDWCVLRYILWLQSKKNMPGLKEHMTAYTPAETASLLKQPEVVRWQKEMLKIKIPEHIETIVLVPCAKGKRWDHASVKSLSGSTYKLYHEILNEYNHVYFLTISEPLGIVPQDRWNDFPLYDNPGLFEKDIPLQTDLWTKDWKTLGVDFKLNGKRFIPFDKETKNKVIEILGNNIGEVLKNVHNQNPDLKFISIIDDKNEKKITTHSQMLSIAKQHFDFNILKLVKNPVARNKTAKKESLLKHL